MLASSRWQLHLAAYWVSVSLASAWRLRQRAEERERKTLELAAGLSQAKLDARLKLPEGYFISFVDANGRPRKRKVAGAHTLQQARSALAAENLQRMGYTNVASLAGGFKAWKDAGYPVATGPEPGDPPE
jgi:3-mercaptopyruvate sulfurtransferase SseA